MGGCVLPGESSLRPRPTIAYLSEKSLEAPAWIAQEKRSRAETYKEGHCGFKVGEFVVSLAVCLLAPLIASLDGGSTVQQHAETVSLTIYITGSQRTIVLHMP